MSAVDTYVADLGAALHGSARAKHDLLQEARDHLVDAADAYVDEGMTMPAAEQRAVRDFGTLPEVAPSYQAILSVGQTRRVGLWMLAAIVAQPFAWEFWATLPYGQYADARGGVFEYLDAYVETVGAATLVFALLTVVGCGIGTRFLGVRDWVVRLALTSVALSSVLIIVTAMAMVATGVPTLVGIAYAAAVTWAPMTALTAACVSALRGVDVVQRLAE
ncbi:permease prefix domain 1-containing protein [Nocardioidaceae bacterium SCSIO 66511]|nr:permease prefix domain 1-containing protein [Nocardioidaceae bacterium SCSIO 66511]